MAASDIVIPLAAETATLDTRTVRTGAVRIAISVESQEQTIPVELNEQTADIERVPVGQFVAVRPAMRTEGDTVFIPIVEERPVLVTRLFLREEIRIRTRSVKRRENHAVTLHAEQAHVDRDGPIQQGNPDMQNNTSALDTSAAGGMPMAEPGEARHTFASLFATREQADRAAEAIAQAGIPRGDINVVGQGATAGAQTGAEPQGEGFWGGLKRALSSNDDAVGYAEGINRGQTLVSVRTTQANADMVAGILERHEPLDLDAQEADWRAQGWTGGYHENVSGTGTAGMGASRAGATETISEHDNVAGEGVTGTGRTATAAGVTPNAVPTGVRRDAIEAGDQVLNTAEERLAIGKRDVNRGSVRVRSYVVETPVNEEVTLHRETVTIDRRPGEGATDAVAADAFTERTIEMTETDEEPVVSKTAHVTGSVRVRKEVIERTEHVADTVRRTEVEVEDDRTGTQPGMTKPGAASPGTTRPVTPAG